MKKGLVLFLFFVTGVVFSQTKSNNQTYYFFSIAYGQNNEVYVTNVFEANIDNKDIYKKLADRYTKFQNFLLSNETITSLKEIQTGYEKNYQQKEQALAEQKYLLSTLEKQNFTVKMISYSF